MMNNLLKGRFFVVAIQMHLICCVLTRLQVQAQQSKPPSTSQDDVIRIETSLVTLPVRVRDDHGKVVHGLARDQFRIFENGIEQEISFFEAPSDLTRPGETAKPLNVALMLDASDSTEFKLENIQTAALAFVDSLRAGDRVLVVVFDASVRVLTHLTEDRDKVRAAIRSIQTGGGTSLYNAVDEVVGRSLARVAGPKVVVLLSDGVDTTSEGSTFESTIRAAETSDATIYPIQYETYADFLGNSRYSVGSGSVTLVTRKGEYLSEAYKRATRYLRLLADKTAGHFQYAQGGKNLARAFANIAEQLRQQYIIGYYPKEKTTSRRKIDVKVAAPNTTVQTRRNYFYRGN